MGGIKWCEMTNRLPFVHSDCPPVMPSRPNDFGYGYDPNWKLHSKYQSNLQIASSLQRIDRPNSIYEIENHYKQATEV